jgi:hypothetical protein
LIRQRRIAGELASDPRPLFQIQTQKRATDARAYRLKQSLCTSRMNPDAVRLTLADLDTRRGEFDQGLQDVRDGSLPTVSVP